MALPLLQFIFPIKQEVSHSQPVLFFSYKAKRQPLAPAHLHLLLAIQDVPSHLELDLIVDQCHQILGKLTLVGKKSLLFSSFPTNGNRCTSSCSSYESIQVQMEATEEAASHCTRSQLSFIAGSPNPCNFCSDYSSVKSLLDVCSEQNQGPAPLPLSLCLCVQVTQGSKSFSFGLIVTNSQQNILSHSYRTKPSQRRGYDSSLHF